MKFETSIVNTFLQVVLKPKFCIPTIRSVGRSIGRYQPKITEGRHVKSVGKCKMYRTVKKEIFVLANVHNYEKRNIIVTFLFKKNRPQQFVDLHLLICQLLLKLINGT